MNSRPAIFHQQTHWPAASILMAEDSQGESLVTLTADIVSAYVSNNSLATADLPSLIGRIHQSLALAAKGQETPAPMSPAVPVKKSVTPDYIVCLEDGKRFKSLKRHLGTAYDLTPDQYRQKWNLPSDYPMVAPNYAAARSALARASGLGRKPKQPAPAKRGRRKATA
jgi:predicted transcriptional regulator